LLKIHTCSVNYCFIHFYFFYISSTKNCGPPWGRFECGGGSHDLSAVWCAVIPTCWHHLDQRWAGSGVHHWHPYTARWFAV